MYNPLEVRRLIQQATAGDTPPIGNVADAEGVIGFSFGLRMNPEGGLEAPGPVNEALASFIVGHEVLRTKPLTLQEELAQEVVRLDKTLRGNVESIPTMKAPGKTFNTREVLQSALPHLDGGVKAVVAFRHHLPRAVAQVRKTGFTVVTPNMSGVGDFDPNSSQEWIQDAEAWATREAKVISYFALRNWI